MQDTNSAQAAGEQAEGGLNAALIMAEGLIEQAVAFLPNVLGALAVFIVGMWLANRVRGLVKVWFSRSNRLDATLESFLTSFAYYASIALVIVTTLGVFGVQTTSLAAVIGAAGLAIGLALQGTLGHLASGVMLLGFRPFQLGDYIEAAGHSGTVKAMTLFTTELATPDNKKIIIPNGEIWSSSVVNYSAYDTRRVDFSFGIAYDADIDRAMAAIKSEVEKETRAHGEPEPVIEVGNLGDSSVDILCRVWVERADYFPVKWALTKAVKQRFDADDIDIPFPTRTVHTKAA